jgi:hypothetical protein
MRILKAIKGTTNNFNKNLKLTFHASANLNPDYRQAGSTSTASAPSLFFISY